MKPILTAAMFALMLVTIGMADPDATPSLPTLAAIRLDSDPQKGFEAHKGKEVRLAASATEFRILPGLKDPHMVSLEAVGEPGAYLRHKDSLIWLHERPRKVDLLFEGNASFRLIDLGGDKYRLEASGLADMFISVKNDGRVVLARNPPLEESIFVFTPLEVAVDNAGKGQAQKVLQPPAPATPAPLPNPVTELSPFILKLDGLLAIRRPDKPTQSFATEASGKLLILRQKFVAARETAPNEKKGMFDAAIKTSDLIGAALEDRSRVMGDLGASGAVENDGKMEEPSKKDNLTQGIHGGDLAKAVGSIVERDRERQFIARGEERAAASDNALSAMAKNEWNKRAAQWRGQIAAAYGQIK